MANSIDSNTAEENSKTLTEKTIGSMLKRFLWRCVRGIAILYLAIILMMSFLESRLVYPAPRLDRSDWNPAGNAHEEVWIDVASTNGDTDGKPASRVHGWFYDLADADKVMLYCHGNGTQVADTHELMLQYRDDYNAAILVFDYRGYGKSEGKPNEAGVMADALAAQRWLAQRTDRTTDSIVLIGRSLGGGVATALAHEQGAAALILQSTFTQLPDAAAYHYPWLPVRWIMRNRFDSIGKIVGFNGPLLISHGTNDEVVPYEHGRRLFEASRSEIKQFVELPGAGHNGSLPASYYAKFGEFLDNQLPNSP